MGGGERGLGEARIDAAPGEQGVERRAIGGLVREAGKQVAPVPVHEAVVARATRERGEAQAGLGVARRAARGLELGDVMGRDGLVGRDQDRQPDEFLLEGAERPRVERQRGVGLVIGARETRRGQREQSMMRQEIAALRAHGVEDGHRLGF